LPQVWQDDKEEKDYHTRKRRDHSKNKEYVRLCYKCKSLNHVVAECPYNSDNDEHEKKNNKKKKMVFKKKKKGGSYVVQWDSDASSDEDSSDDDKASKKKKALASIAINNKPLLFDIPPCFMAKGHKVQYDKSESENENEYDNDSDDENEFSNEQLMDMLEQVDSLIHSKKQEVQRIGQEVKIS